MRPNILYIHSHDTGRWCEPYSFPVAMPVYSRCAREGLLLGDVHCAGPTCSPSRAGLLTGMHAHSAGMIGLAHRGFSLRDVKTHVVHTLHAAGYTSLLCGIQHVMPTAEQIGYSEIVTHKHAEVLPKLLHRLRQPMREPFFLDVGFFETHRPFPPAAASIDRHRLVPPPSLGDGDSIREDMAAYATMAQTLDTKVGHTLEALAAAGVADRTLVIITTDHGPAFPGMKCNLNTLGTGVLLMLRGPGVVAGQRSNALLSQIDIFPTLCDYLGIATPAWVQGRSFAPLLAGKPYAGNDAVYSEVTYHAAYEPQRMVRTATHCYIRRFSDRRQPVLPNCDAGLSKSAWLATDWPHRSVPHEQLYHLPNDPHEQRNLVGDAAHVAAHAALRQRLEQWMQATNDPLLAGPVPAPLGARMTPVDAPEPEDHIFAVGPQHAGKAAEAP